MSDVIHSRAVSGGASSPNGATRPRIVWASKAKAEEHSELRALLAECFEVTMLAHGQGAAMGVPGTPPELVLCDWAVLTAKGNNQRCSLLRALKADAQTRNIPFIVLSARSREEAVLEALAAGADDFLATSLTAREILARLQTHLTRAKLQKEWRVELERSQHRHRLALEIAQIGEWELNLGPQTARRSQRLDQIFGYAELLPEWSYEFFLQHVHPEDRERVDQTFQESAAAVRDWSCECRIIHPDQSVHWILIRGAIFKDDSGQPARMLSMVRDITVRKRTDAAIRDSEKRFKNVAKATADAIWDWNLECDTLWWNDGVQNLFGFASDEDEPGIEASTSRIHPEDKDRVIRGLHAAIDGKAENWSDEYRFLRKDGSYAWVRDRGFVFRTPEGKPVRMMGGIMDVTAQKEGEIRLREQATLLDKAQDAIWVQDLQHRVTYWNNSAERLYGWTAAEVQGRSIEELAYRDKATFWEASATLLKVGEWKGELRHYTKKGDEIIVEARWTLVRDTAGQPRSVLAINTDITEKKKLELQFLRAQRMESIGTLAGGIAHDLNNVLAPIILSIDVLKMNVSDETSRELLAVIGGSAQRGAEMVHQVLSFARGMEGRRIAIQVKDLLREIEKIAQDTFPKNIEIRTQLNGHLRSLLGDPTQLHQVLLNLFVNARDAMPEGGRITVSAENADLDARYAAVNIEARAGAHVRIVVEDTGSGMPKETLEKIFDPFFTTKEVGKGTGLGLSTSLAIVKSHGGFIRVSSNQGTGTRFRLYLPAQTESAHQSAEPETVELPRGNGETVLVIDDELSIRQVTRRTLEAFGYRALLAANGVEALDLYAQSQREIAVVLTDMMMPVMDGAATIRVLMKINPAVRIIAASGISTDGKMPKAVAQGITHFLPKPYTTELLLKKLEQILADPPSAVSMQKSSADFRR